MSFYDKVRRQKFLSFTLILFTLSIGIVIGTLVQTGAKAAKEQTVAADATPLTVPAPVHMENDFSRVAKMLEPSVVNISTRYIPKTEAKARPNANPRRRQQQQPDDDDDTPNGGPGAGGNGNLQDFFNRFFGGPNGGQGFQFGEPEDQPSASLGSGVVVDKNGYILTNNHVVEKATKITVKFMNDPEEYPAMVIGTDSDTDLAVIHVENVDKKKLVPAKIGNSEALDVGDWTVAIGSPFGFQATVTAGIVSAIGRDIPGDAKASFQHFIQTDAAINPGNSGGPLANIRGEVIGINTMIASRSGGYQGIGFAMPINTGVKVYNEIIKTGHVTRGSIGIRFREDANTGSLLKVYGAEHGGVFVSEVEPNQPADKGGLKAEDIIVSINGKPVQKGQDLIDIVADSAVGSTLKLGIIRDKKPQTVDVVVGDRTKIFAQEYGGAPSDDQPDTQNGATKMKFGMSVAPLRAGDRQNLGYKGNGGVLISSIEPGSFADDIGLVKGDIIVELNREKVSSPDDIRRIQGTLKPGQPVAFQVMRQVPGAGRGGQGNGSWQSFFAAGTVPSQQQ
jgi:serine protease Do